METLTKEERNSAAAAGMSEIEFARAKARLSASRNTAGLSREELAVARNAGMSSRAFASRLRGLKGSKRAIAAGEREDKPGLLRAHQEVDRAHIEAYDTDHPQSSANISDLELLDAARAALDGYDPDKDDDAMYDLLCEGVVYAMRLLNRVAPAYADSKSAGKK